MGKTIGIIGYGNTGKSLAKKLSGFDMNILVYDKYDTEIKEKYTSPASLEDLLSKSDIISFHLPLNEETKHFLNKNLLLKTSKKPIIINASRGAIANTTDLLWAVENNIIGGLCIDVFEDEPISKEKTHSASTYSQLLKHNHVCASPHIAGWTVESKIKLASILMDRIEGFYDQRNLKI